LIRRINAAAPATVTSFITQINKNIIKLRKCLATYEVIRYSLAFTTFITKAQVRRTTSFYYWISAYSMNFN
jgi:hypothetical protein